MHLLNSLSEYFIVLDPIKKPDEHELKGTKYTIEWDYKDVYLLSFKIIFALYLHLRLSIESVRFEIQPIMEKAYY